MVINHYNSLSLYKDNAFFVKDVYSNSSLSLLHLDVLCEFIPNKFMYSDALEIV